jgi:hypothetical protein
MKKSLPPGPEQPTFIERFAALLPLPYLLSGAVWAVLLGPPSIVLANLVYSGRWGESLRLFFPMRPPAAGWQRVLAVVFWSVLCWYGFWMVRYIRTRLQAAEDQIAPLLPEGRAGYRRAFRAVTRPLGGILIAVFLSAAFLRTTLISYRNAPGPLLWVWRTLYPNFFYLVLGVGCWVYFSSLWGLRRLGRQSPSLRVYNVDNMMGLRVIGSLALSISYAFFGFLAITTSHLLFGPVLVEYLATLGVMLALGVALFFLPLGSIHRRMVEEKRRLRTELNDRVARLIQGAERAAPRRSASAAAQLAGAVSELRQVLTQGLAERKIDALATWPFDTKALGKLSATVLSVAAGLILNVLVKRVLKL